MIRSLADIVGEQLAAILRSPIGSAAQAERIDAIFRIVAQAALDRPAVPPFAGLSFVNANGLPFQWVFRFGADGDGWGFLCDPGQPGRSPRERFISGLEQIRLAAIQGHGANPGWLEEFAALLAPCEAEWPAHWRSFLWIGVAVAGRRIGIRPYFNLNRGSCHDRWMRAGYVLQALGRTSALEQLCAISGACSTESWPVGLAVDIDPSGQPGRVKIYFRSGLVEPSWLARWYGATRLGREEPILRRMLDLLGPVGARCLAPGSLTVSLEVHADEALSLKTDLAVTKWQADAAVTLDGAAALVAEVGGASAALRAACAAVDAWPTSAADPASGAGLVRFVGLGSEPGGARHVNLYLEPSLARAAGPVIRGSRRRGSGGGVARGLDALMALRTGTHWQDFAPPVGASDAWVTAYVLAATAEAGPAHPAFASAASAALEWLMARRTPGAGWGYNATTPNDADSTAWAIIALRAWGRAVPAGALAFLRTCATAGGYFATYPRALAPRPGWARPAADVTAVAARALALDLPADFWTQDNARPPSAYWWSAPYYTTAMALRCPVGADPPGPVRAAAATAIAGHDFERALLLQTRVLLGLPGGELAARLLASQRADGTWPAAARLRLTDADVPDPAATLDSGPVYHDVRHVFTTATAVAALSLAGSRELARWGCGPVPIPRERNML